ncbi:MAG: DUF547 domain-containing protein [Gammaproteobacteria bacterium]|jgi:hypothetical protein|nr:hypothetical protein [Chromatiales bacterium]MDP6674627.1 DUF547 domain-containing protein [Gammaproteobacteria bacterium]
MKEIIDYRHRHPDCIRLINRLGLLLLTRLLPTLALLVSVAQAQLPDYDALDEILARNVRNGFVDYDGIASEPQLGTFIEQLGATQPADLTSTNDKLAFYINAYNVLAIQGILNGQSPSSWWGRRKFFRQQKFNVLGEMISLQTLEHERIITLGDQRIHFAIICASISCPRLSSHAYRPERLDKQLHAAAKQFINDPTRNRFDAKRKNAFLSRIFEWYADDFIAAGGTLQRYLARFVTDAPAQDILRLDEFSIQFIDYDWNLNGRYRGKD